jgi:hypothetical protein
MWPIAAQNNSSQATGFHGWPFFVYLESQRGLNRYESFAQCLVLVKDGLQWAIVLLA